MYVLSISLEIPHFLTFLQNVANAKFQQRLSWKIKRYGHGKIIQNLFAKSLVHELRYCSKETMRNIKVDCNMY